MLPTHGRKHLTLLVGWLIAGLAAPVVAAPSFTIVGDSFQRDGSNVTLVSAEIHYWRVVPADWAARLAALRQCGFNAVTTYVLWSLHEPQPSSFNWAPPGGDVVAWIHAIQAAGLLAIVRVGPYITAEVDWGGLPYWLATVPGIRLRTNDTTWLGFVDRYLDALIPLLVPLQYSAGGPIVSFQVEDDTDTLIPAAETEVYYAHLVAGLRARGITGLINTLCGPTTPFSCERAATPGAWLALEFGVGDIAPADACSGVRGVYPHGPCMVLETYPGWYDQVPNPHVTMDAALFANWTDEILGARASLSVYMAHGGTNFGFSNGADVYFNLSSPDLLKYGPITTSYDYDAPLSEAGDPTPKYAALKAVFARYVPVPPGPPPPPVPKTAYGLVPLPSCAPLAPLLAPGGGGPFRTVSGRLPLSMEALGQAFGFVAYTVALPAALPPAGAVLSVAALQDRGLALLDGVPQGGALGWSEAVVTLAARLVPPAPPPPAPQSLTLLVENAGRCSGEVVDTGCARKGVLGAVTLDGAPLAPRDGGNWSMTLLPMTGLGDLATALPWGPCAAHGAAPAFYRGSLRLPPAPAVPNATFLRVVGWGHGFAAVNGFNLGRFTSRGPQRTLYVPAPVLRPGANDLLLFESDPDAGAAPGAAPTVEFVAALDWGSTLNAGGSAGVGSGGGRSARSRRGQSTAR